MNSQDDSVPTGPEESTAAEPLAAVTVPSTGKTGKPRKSRSAVVVEETVARHQKSLAEALEKAQAIQYEPAPVDTQTPPVKPEKPAKVRKTKLVRDTYAMPEKEYDRLVELKQRLVAMGSPFKKSEMLRAGIAQLTALGDDELLAALQRIERIKTGRPRKK